MKVSILGSTGSIGTQTLEVIDQLNANGCEIEVLGLTAGSNLTLFLEQISKYHPKIVSIADSSKYNELKQNIPDEIEAYCGQEGSISVGSLSVDITICAMCGTCGFLPILSAIKSSKRVAIANKEPLVMAGNIIMKEAKKFGVEILPIDSEHSAIFQCLLGRSQASKIILTASGGPFYKRTPQELKNVTLKEVLAHPTWKMGAKITVDSATLMNKGFEIIEAHHLFGISNIEVVIQRESIIHSMVEFSDGNIIAQISPPDMRYPISYAITYPNNCESDFGRINFSKLKNLTFDLPDSKTFNCLELAKEALLMGKVAPVILTLANDFAVSLFMRGEIKFLDIPRFVEMQLNNSCSSYAKEDLQISDIIKIENEFTKQMAADFSSQMLNYFTVF